MEDNLKEIVISILIVIVLWLFFTFIEGVIVRWLIGYIFEITIPIRKSVALIILINILFKSRYTKISS